MRSGDLRTWMWSEALSMLDQAERLHRQFFRMGSSPAQTWEPPVDIVETADALRVQVALPGVRTDAITVGVDASGLTVSALRPFAGGAGRGAQLHRIEIPYGRFERRIPLPMDALVLAGKALADGCLTLTLVKRQQSGESP